MGMVEKTAKIESAKSKWHWVIGHVGVDQLWATQKEDQKIVGRGSVTKACEKCKKCDDNVGAYRKLGGGATGK